MIKSVLDWMDERIEIRTLWKFVADRSIPGGSSWFYVLGSALAFIFVIQLLTGIVLAMYYAPTPDHAYASVKYIQEKAFLGSFIRGLHHWGASFMMVIIALHMLRVFTFGSYKKPREMVWVAGVGLIGIVFGFAFTGYLLPWDQKAYWATVVGTNVFGTLPVVGPLMLKIARGGIELGNLTLSRFYAIHTFILPWSLALLAGLHIFLMEAAGPGGKWDPSKNTPDKAEPLFPHQIYKDAIFILLVFIALAACAVFSPAELEPQADPTDNTYNPRPEWYFYFVFQLLRIFEGRYEIIGTFVLPAIAGLLLVLLPFLDRSPERSPIKRKLLVPLSGLAVISVIGLTIQGALAPIVQPSPKGSPVAAVQLVPVVANSNVEAGRILYQKSSCSGCHSIHGSGGTTGPDLTHVGTRRDIDWLVRHFKDPQSVSPGSIMPKVTLPDDQLHQLAEYMLSLK